MENVVLAPETMGKQNQLGDLAEVLGFCQLSPKLIPTIDFGHLYAVTGGQYITRGEIETVFDQVVAALGEQVAANIHIHFSRIEFTTKGEKRHWTFEDDAYGPPHLPLLEVIAARGYTPRIICESAGTQARDARTMQETYWQLVGKKG
jgi:deoxyribonuclease-4